MKVSCHLSILRLSWSLLYAVYVMVLSCLLTALVAQDAFYLSSFPAVLLLFFLYGLACVSQVLKPNFLTTWFITMLMSLNMTPEPFSQCSGLYPLHGHTNWHSWVDSLTQQQRFESQPEGLTGSRLATKDLIWNSDQPTKKDFSVFYYTDPAHQRSVCLANGSVTFKDIYFLQWLKETSVLTDPLGFHALLPPKDLQTCRLHGVPHHISLWMPEPRSADRKSSRTIEVVSWSLLSFCI